MVDGGVTTTYSCGSYNRLSTASTSSWTATYTFDKAGNLKTLVNGTNTWNYYYDFENRLTSVVKNAATLQNSTYDTDGRRIKATGMGTIYYSYLGLNIICEKNITGTNTITKHFYANGMQVAKMVGSSTSYFQTDILGSTRLVTSSSGSQPSTIFSSDYSYSVQITR